MLTNSETRRLLAVLLLGLLGRVVVMVPGFGRLDDPDRYLPLARTLAEGRGLRNWDGKPTAQRPPLYPILLAPIVGGLDDHRLPYGVAILNSALGLGTIALTYLTARCWGYSPNRSMAAAAIVALDPVSLAQARVVMTEPLAAFLVASCLAATTYRGPLLSGATYGLASLCRPSLLPGALLVGLSQLVVGPGRWDRRLARSLIFASGVVGALLPWAIRNTRAIGEPIWTTTHGGYTLALANNPVYYADVVDGPAGSVWSGPTQRAWFEWVARSTAGMTPTQADRYLQGEGLRMARERPWTFLRASVARLGRFWGIAPAETVYSRPVRLLTAAWTAPLWVALALGLARPGLWRWPAIDAPLVILGLTLVHTVFWTDTRMRAPVVPAIALVSCGAAIPWRKNAEGRRNSAGQSARNR